MKIQLEFARYKPLPRSWSWITLGTTPLNVSDAVSTQMGVTIRLYEESDAEAMTAAARESTADVLPWMPWCHAEYSAADALRWIRATRDGHSTETMHEFAIADSTGQYAGGCGINQISLVTGVANLGYWVRSSLAGRGIAPAAVLELVPWAFQHTPLHRLEIVAAVANHRSQRVAEKAGAHRDAVLRKRIIVNGAPSDAVLYSILRP
ncbi:MAG TPA: GNAT family protein [Polyangia bacterium]|jgi:RimJ/RimL family protein N-acetyltransferase|nr:GNAT family protein [Polyangia bacterium]